MAYQTIATYRVEEFEQEEIIEKKLVAGADGVVEEVEELIQPYVHFWVDATIYQNILEDENRSTFKAELTYNAVAGEKGKGFNLFIDGTYSYTPSNYIGIGFTESNNDVAISSKFNSISEKISPGETYSYTISCERLTEQQKLYHKIDGSPCLEQLVLRVVLDAQITLDEDNYKQYQFAKYYYPTLASYNRAVKCNTANNFTDEEVPSFSYSAYTGKSIHSKRENSNSYNLLEDRIASLQASISFDGVTEAITYRSIPVSTSGFYTFQLTDAEREYIREQTVGAANVPIYYLIKVIRECGDGSTYERQSHQAISATKRTLSIVGSEPTLNPSVIDIKPETIALTGNPNIFVRYESMVEFATGAVASKHATIVSQSVQCGSKIIYDMYNGVFEEIEDKSFIFNATDSRGLAANQVVISNTGIIEYVKPTIKQELTIEMSGDVGAVVALKVSGNYYNGSFGAADNTLQLQVRYKQGSGNYGAWQTISGTPTYKNNMYELQATFEGLNYDAAYTFQCRATDKLNTVETSSYTIRLLPIFDWSNEDFNFNVPVNLSAAPLNMNGETIIRHNEAASNTVFSATGGKIYLRPGGTDDTEGQVIINSDGRVDISSANFTNGFTIGGKAMADYIVETGEEAMGTNGTWYWCKWASGKAEAWGCRNFGNTAVTTAWGNLYRSAIFAQDLPEDVFKTTPDVITMNVVNANFGGWICKHENAAPSAVTTGSFIFVRPASATVSPLYIGFHIIGIAK